MKIHFANSKTKKIPKIINYYTIDYINLSKTKMQTNEMNIHYNEKKKMRRISRDD